MRTVTGWGWSLGACAALVFWGAACSAHGVKEEEVPDSADAPGVDVFTAGDAEEADAPLDVVEPDVDEQDTIDHDAPLASCTPIADFMAAGAEVYSDCGEVYTEVYAGYDEFPGQVGCFVQAFEGCSPAFMLEHAEGGIDGNSREILWYIDGSRGRDRRCRLGYIREALVDGEGLPLAQRVVTHASGCMGEVGASASGGRLVVGGLSCEEEIVLGSCRDVFRQCLQCMRW